MPTPKPAPALGFDLAELTAQVDHYQGPPQAPERPQEAAAPARPPAYPARDAQPCQRSSIGRPAAMAPARSRGADLDAPASATTCPGSSAS